MVDAIVNGRPVRALLDTGCSQSIIAPFLSAGCKGGRCDIITVDGSAVQCLGQTVSQVALGGRTYDLMCIVAKRLLPGVDAIAYSWHGCNSASRRVDSEWRSSSVFERC